MHKDHTAVTSCNEPTSGSACMLEWWHSSVHAYQLCYCTQLKCRQRLVHMEYKSRHVSPLCEEPCNFKYGGIWSVIVSVSHTCSRTCTEAQGTYCHTRSSIWTWACRGWSRVPCPEGWWQRGLGSCSASKAHRSHGGHSGG